MMGLRGINKSLALRSVSRELAYDVRWLLCLSLAINIPAAAVPCHRDDENGNGSARRREPSDLVHYRLQLRVLDRRQEGSL
ncbi:hypothetical protein V1504DRAFT_460609 [Lipomyces starkeyi]